MRKKLIWKNNPKLNSVKPSERVDPQSAGKEAVKKVSEGKEDCNCECKIYNLNCINVCLKISCQVICIEAFMHVKTLICLIIGDKCTEELFDEVCRAKAQAIENEDIKNWLNYTRGKWGKLLKMRQFQKFYALSVYIAHLQLGSESVDTGISGGDVTANLNSMGVFRLKKLKIFRLDAVKFQVWFENYAKCLGCQCDMDSHLNNFKLER